MVKEHRFCQGGCELFRSFGSCEKKPADHKEYKTYTVKSTENYNTHLLFPPPPPPPPLLSLPIPTTATTV
jgi:hypothetical protein